MIKKRIITKGQAHRVLEHGHIAHKTAITFGTVVAIALAYVGSEYQHHAIAVSLVTTMLWVWEV